jgi:hypothetical protein
MSSAKHRCKKQSSALVKLSIQRTARVNALAKRMSIFDEQYRVVAVEGDRLLIKGEISGTVLVIVNPQPESPLSADDYPLGKLIALTDPSAAPLN